MIFVLFVLPHLVSSGAKTQFQEKGVGYHVTRECHLKSIYEKGLKPGFGEGWDSAPGREVAREYSKQGVFFTSDIRIAIQVLAKAKDENIGPRNCGNPVLLKFSLPFGAELHRDILYPQAEGYAFYIKQEIDRNEIHSVLMKDKNGDLIWKPFAKSMHTTDAFFDLGVFYEIFGSLGGGALEFYKIKEESENRMCARCGIRK